MASITETDLLSSVDRIADEVIAAHAVAVDVEARFPAESMRALADAGLWGLISAAHVGGMAMSPRVASAVVRRIARQCSSTAMVYTMHLCAVSVLEACGGPESIRRDCARGAHLTTLAFSEAGSRSQFWAPTSTAREVGGRVVLHAHKSWVTSAHHADSYVWSSKPLSAEGLSTIWLVPSKARGLEVRGSFDGLGLRGNDSSPVVATGVEVAPNDRLGEDGKGFDVMMGAVLPLFQLLNASCSLGVMQSAVERTIAHASQTRFEHDGSALRDLPTIRNHLARMKIETDMVETLVDDTAEALVAQRPDAMLRVLEVKAAAGESAFRVLDTAMRVCGGAAFRKDVGVERAFRDGRAAGVMAPTTDVLYDFVGKAITGMELFG